MDEETTAPVVPGYHLGAVLGRGSSATVWAARRVADGRALAVKVVPGGQDAGDAAVRELAVLRGVRADHLVTLVDAVAVHDPDGLAMVMERLDGGSLRQVVAARGRLTAGETVTVLSPVAAALGALHAQGVVHGDVAPGNVLFDASGRPALADLGVARIIGEAVRDVWGTDGFVAPEVMSGGPTTPASDVYAVGALAWLALTGAAPGPSFLRPSAVTICGAGTELAAAVDRFLAGEPADRPDAVEAANLLYAAAVVEPLRLPGDADEVASLTRRIRDAAIVPGDEPSVPAARHRGSHRRPRRWPRGRVSVVGVALAVSAVLATVVALVAVAVGWDPRATASATASPAAAPVTPAVSTPAHPPPLSPTPTKASTSARASTPTQVPGQPRAPTPARPSAQRLASARPTPGADVLRDKQSVRRDPRAVAQALADARARIWTALDPARVGTVDAAGSTAHTADVAALRTARSGGWRYEGVRFTVRSATVERSADASATVRVVLDSPAYVVVGADASQTRSARSGEVTRLELVWTEDGWRVARVSTG